MASTHPTDKLISLYASGEASDGVSLAIAAHLTYCPACRARVAAAEAVAAAVALPEVSEQNDVPAPSFDAIRMRLSDDDVDTGARACAEPAVQAGPLPAPVAAMVGVDFDSIPWRFRLPGVSDYEMTSEGGDSISLLRVRPGAAVPQHTHTGEELTVVFSGVLEDGGKSFGVGALAMADHDVHHHPRAGGDETCICLAVVSGGLTFTGAFGRALNLFS